MKLRASQKQGFVVLTIPEDVTFQTCGALKAQLDRALTVFPGPWMALDLGQVAFINSSGVGLLVELLRSLRARGGGLYLVRVHEHIRRLLEKTKLHEDLVMVADEAAVAARVAAAAGD